MIIHNPQDIGDQPTIVASFADINGTPANPSAITFQILPPSGVVVTLDETDAVSSVTGEWQWLLPTPFDEPGLWAFRVAGTAGVIAAEETTVTVQRSRF